MTDRTHPDSGFPIAYSHYATYAEYVEALHARIAELEAQLESIGAGGVSGPLMGQPQAMPDLSALTERGAKAWAGVDAQGLRDGVASGAASAGSEPVAPAGAVVLCWVNEDELPEGLTQEAYSALFPHSKVDGVRMFPIFGPTAQAAPAGAGTWAHLKLMMEESAWDGTLQLSDALANIDDFAALVEAQQPATHVQNPAEIEHVAGDVSKNGPESNMTRAQVDAIVYACRQAGDDSTYAVVNAALQAQQPAPSAAAVVGDKQKESEMKVWFRPARMHGQPERTPIKATITKDRGNGIVDLTFDDEGVSGNARAVPNALRLPRNVREQVAVWWDVGFEMDFQTAVENSLGKKKDSAPQPSPTPQADIQPAPVRCPACSYQHGHAIGCENNPVDISLAAQALVAARAPADSVTAPAYSIDADPQGIRARVADAITGALAFGAQGANPPPTGHWLVPFWETAREEASRNRPVSSDTLYLLRRLLSNQHTLTGSEFREELTKIVGEATQAADSVLEDAELGRIAMRFVDRAGDPHPGIDDAETICREFHAAMSAVLDPRFQRRMDAARKQGGA